MMKSGTRLGAAVVGAWLLVACVPPLQRAKSTFSADFNCPDATAEETVAEGRYRVNGCGHTASYACFENGVCHLQLVDRDSPSAPRGSPSTSDSTRAKGSGKLAATTRTEATSEGALMKLELALEPRALLRLTATPDKEQNVVQLKLVREDEAGGTAACSLDFMVNGQVLGVPKSVASRTGNVQSHRVRIGRALIEDFSTANKIALRVCKDRWSLTGEQVLKVRDFMDRFQEEIAWKAPPRSGGTGGMMPPSGGWPEWKTSATAPPPAASGAPLDGSALFKKLAPSVFVLEAIGADGTAQGSAVAVSQTELLTNCHVVQGALKVTLKQAKKSWTARVVRADPRTDRCTLTAEGASLTPVAGVRSYSSLEVGEAAYTLGTPVGLELTLSNGIVSGQREEDGRSFVQTTAPISPGSSGGGLFDSRGNLIGITTLVLAGKERLNQSLNFAIPAAAYFESPVGKAQF
jgi:S1-C subfamily serine protease